MSNWRYVSAASCRFGHLFFPPFLPGAFRFRAPVKETSDQAIPSCCSEGFPPKYPVVTAGEYVRSRLEETFAHSKK